MSDLVALAKKVRERRLSMQQAQKNLALAAQVGAWVWGGGSAGTEGCRASGTGGVWVCVCGGGQQAQKNVALAV